MNLLNKGKNLLTDAVKGKTKIDTFTVYTELSELEADYAFKKANQKPVMEAGNLFIPDKMLRLEENLKMHMIQKL